MACAVSPRFILNPVFILEWEPVPLLSIEGGQLWHPDMFSNYWLWGFNFLPSIYSRILRGSIPKALGGFPSQNLGAVLLAVTI